MMRETMVPWPILAHHIIQFIVTSEAQHAQYVGALPCNYRANLILQEM